MTVILEYYDLLFSGSVLHVHALSLPNAVTEYSEVFGTLHHTQHSFNDNITIIEEMFSYAYDNILCVQSLQNQ